MPLYCVNVKACLWPTRCECLIHIIACWQAVIWNDTDTTLLCSFTAVIHIRVLLMQSRQDRLSRWGGRRACPSGSFAPETGPRRSGEGQRCCDSTGSLWSPAAHVRERRWSVGCTAGVERSDKVGFTPSECVTETIAHQNCWIIGREVSKFQCLPKVFWTFPRFVTLQPQTSKYFM